jgi:hypothetical protein
LPRAPAERRRSPALADLGATSARLSGGLAPRCASPRARLILVPPVPGLSAGLAPRCATPEPSVHGHRPPALGRWCSRGVVLNCRSRLRQFSSTANRMATPVQLPHSRHVGGGLVRAGGSWQVRESDEQMLHVLLHARDALGLDADGPGVPPRLRAAPPELGGPEAGRETAQAWTAWWQDHVSLVVVLQGVDLPGTLPSRRGRASCRLLPSRRTLTLGWSRTRS